MKFKPLWKIKSSINFSQEFSKIPKAIIIRKTPKQLFLF